MSKSNAVKLAVLVAILGTTGYLAFRPTVPRPLAIGDRAPDFSVPTLSASPLKLADYPQQVLVVNFWATWCPPCVDEAPSFERFAERVGREGVVVLGVSVDEDAGALKDFIDKYHVTYPVGRDPARALAARFGTVQFPETYILDRNGRLAEKVVGAIDWDDPRILTFVRSLASGS